MLKRYGQKPDSCASSCGEEGWVREDNLAKPHRWQQLRETMIFLFIPSWQCTEETGLTTFCSSLCSWYDLSPLPRRILTHTLGLVHLSRIAAGQQRRRQQWYLREPTAKPGADASITRRTWKKRWAFACQLPTIMKRSFHTVG